MNPLMQNLAPPPIAGDGSAPPAPDLPDAGLQPADNPSNPISADVVEQQIQQFIQQHPAAVAQIKQVIAQATASGELDPQELNMLAGLAITVLRNPALYPQIREYIIQQGIASEADVPKEYDQGLVIAVLLAARAQQGNPSTDMPGDTSPDNGPQAGLAPPSPAAGRPSFKEGGQVPGTPDQPVGVTAHGGEYVVPSHVVAMKGREFFDKLVAQYADKKPNG